MQTTLTSAKCGAEAAPTAKFCRACGSALIAALPDATDNGPPAGTAAVCGQCGRANAASAKFCRGCGALLAMAQSAPLASGTSSAPAEQEQSVAQTKPIDAAAVRPGDAAALVASAGAANSGRRPEEPELPSPSLGVSTDAGATAPSAAAARWKVPAAVAALLAVAGAGGWLGYAQWGSKAPASADPRADAAAQAPQPTAKPAITKTPAPDATAATAVPAVPMARDEMSGCLVWKPSLQSNDVVKWTGNCAGPLAEGLGRAEWFVDGKAVLTYEGTFKGGMLQGVGRMLAAGGDTYEGEYKDGQRHGTGTYVASSGERYTGQWRENKRDGTGALTYVNGDRYEGEFKSNKRDGTGNFVAADGDRYVGEYRDDRREGRGVLVRADGSRYEGLFRDGRPLGSLTSPPPVARSSASSQGGSQSAPPYGVLEHQSPPRKDSSPRPETQVAKAVAPTARNAPGPAQSPSKPAPTPQDGPLREERKVPSQRPEVPPPKESSVPLPGAGQSSSPTIVAQSPGSDRCDRLAGLRLEQCRSCRESGKFQQLLCEEKVRIMYCIGKGAGTADCPSQPSRQDGGA